MRPRLRHYPRHRRSSSLLGSTFALGALWAVILLVVYFVTKIISLF